ncbi:MAG: 3-oxoacyl-ACP reductase FabG [Spirochaetes bacterium]|uniref:3-oxoacyl-ACP reductase FabG n=1 Tax=Candidatus Ornithospirochaeta stercoripullorum TaxID=2840899 RepID=A0A9D9DZ89_9SPIO|nr:3-oxoacyl-ACP reductase FabG [Candidatus Ornithospirochaeta stercoripullorum]
MADTKTAIVTGGSRGIGREVCLRLAALGYNIAIVYVGDENEANDTIAECNKKGVTAKAYVCNVASFEETKATVAEIRKDFGNDIEFLVNNAGITRDGLIAFMKESDWDSVLSVNLKGAFNMIRHTAALFIKNKGGRIVNISSVSGLMGNAGQANYSASKAGIVGLTKATARELAPKGITCNAVAPGFIHTDMTKNITEDNSELLKTIPLGKMGEASDVASAVVFLLTSPYITGEVLRVDGGIAM